MRVAFLAILSSSAMAACVPEQIFISYGTSPDQMMVSWATSVYGGNTLSYGQSPTSLNSTVQAKEVQYSWS